MKSLERMAFVTSTLYSVVFLSVLFLWALTLPFIARWARTKGSQLRVNLLPAAGVLLAIAALTTGWTITRGDVGMTRLMEVYVAGASLLALVTPLAGLLQLALVLEEISWASEVGGTFTGNGLSLAMLSAIVVLLGLFIPLGYGCRPLNATIKERLLTVSLSKGPA